MTDQGAGFRPALGVLFDQTVADLIATLRAGTYHYVAYVDADNAWARPVDDGLASELDLVTASAPAIDLVKRFEFAVEHRDKSKVPTVDRALQLLEVLSGRLGEKQLRLCVTVDGTVDSVFGVATASVDLSGPAESNNKLFWATDMPRDQTLFDRRVLIAGTTPMLRTRLTFDPTGDDHRLTLPASKFKDRKIQFDVKGRNLKFRPVGVMEGEEVEDRAQLRSDPIAADGSDSFEVLLVPQQAGEAASLRIRLYFVNDGELFHEVGSAPENTSYVSVGFDVIDLEAPAPLPVPDSTSDAQAPTVLQIDPPAPVEWIRWDTSSADSKIAFDRDGRTMGHFIHADEASLPSTYRQLVKELRDLGAGHVADSDDPLAITDEQAQADSLLRFAQLGSRLHSLVYGESANDHRDFLAREQGAHIARLGRDGLTRRLRITDEHHGLPWSLFYDAGYENGRTYPEQIDDVDVEGFWGYRFRIDNDVMRDDRRAWQPHYSELCSETIRITSFVNPTIVGTDTADDLNQSLVASNKRMLGELAAQVSEAGTQFSEWLATDEEVDLLYLFGHGTGARSDSMKDRDSQASLEFGEEAVDVDTLKRARREPWQPTPPLVFINACETMRPDMDFRNPFVELLYRQWHARAVIGCLAPVNARFAIAFAEQVLDRLNTGYRQIGDCLHQTTRELLDTGNPFGLNYVLYGHSELYVGKDES